METARDTRRPNRALLSELRERIRRIEGTSGNGGAGTLPLGVAPIDTVLPGGGLPRAALHALAGDAPAVAGFGAALAARLAGKKGWVLWCRGGADLHGPGLAPFGLDAARLILVRAHRAADLLWAMEEGLRGRALAAVLGEVPDIAPVAARRLQLAAEAGGTGALLLLPRDMALPAATRWKVESIPSTGLERPRWRLNLLRCRGGGAGTWDLEWHHATADGFALAAGLSHRPADPALGDVRPQRRLAG